jgi:anionic cell wall polymer biosynthesis LytR-Cps2A-Psr (LCP) family protein
MSLRGNTTIKHFNKNYFITINVQNFANLRLNISGVTVEVDIEFLKLFFSTP